MVVGRAFLASCRGRAWRRAVECLRQVTSRANTSVSEEKERAVAGGDSAGISVVIARLHRLERSRLFALLHFRQTYMDSADCCRLRGLLFQRQQSLAHHGCRNGVRATRPALRLLQPWKCLVDRSSGCKSPLLRLGLCREHHSCRRFAKWRSFFAFASFMFHSHLRRDRVLRLSSLFSVPLVSENCRNSGRLNRP